VRKFLASRRVHPSGTAKTAGTSPTARLVCDLRGTLPYNSGMIATGQALTKLTTVPSEQEAAIIVAALLEEGIDACYMGETTANFRVGVPGKIYVYVTEAHFVNARRVFDEREAATALNSHADDEITDTRGGWLWKSLVLLVLFLLLLIGVGGSGR
jgi:hypothetical protein